MSGTADDSLVRLDAALLSLRRVIDAPARPMLRQGDDHVEVSTMLVVDAVARMGEHGEVCVTQIASALQVAPSTASRLVERAATSGMVVRATSVEDPRRATLALTANGRALQHRAVAFRTERLASSLREWTPQEVRTLTDLLTRFADSIRSTPDPVPTSGGSR